MSQLYSILSRIFLSGALTLSLMFVTLGFADSNPSISISVEPRSGTLQDSYVYTVTIEGAQTAPHPYLIGGDDFRLTLLGPRNEISIVNGDVKTRTSVVYRLLPKRAGTLETPSAEVEIDGKKYSAQALKVEVSQDQSPPPSEQGEVFLRQSVGKTTLYVGEQTVNSLELYSAVRFLSPQILDLSYDDFSNFEVGENEQTNRFMEGRNFSITRISRAIFPLKSGELNIPQRKVQGRLPTHKPRRLPSFGGIDPFDDDFFGGFLGTTSYENRVLVSNPIQINVLPLPPAPSPLPLWNMTDFLVGVTTVRVEADSKPVKVGESKTVSVKVQSYGNLSALQQVPLDLGSSARVYAESPRQSSELSGNLVLFTKEFTLSVVPLQEGRVTIPALELGFFDPQEKVYKRAQSMPISFNAIPNPLVKESELAPAPPSGASTSAASNTQELQNPIATQVPAITTPALRYQEPTLVDEITSRISSGIALLGLVLLGFCGLVLWLLKSIYSRSQKVRKLANAIERAGSIEELKGAYHRLFFDNDGATSGRTLSECIETISDSDLRFEASALADDLDRFAYGGLKLDHSQLQSFRDRLHELRKRL